MRSKPQASVLVIGSMIAVLCLQYVTSALISPLSAASEAHDAGDNVAQTASVNASGLNLRPEPSTRRPPIARLNQGQSVEILGQEEGWFQVRSGQLIGYVAGAYLTFEDPTTAANKSKETNRRQGPDETFNWPAPRYSVQAAAFADFARATTLIDTLKQKGFTTAWRETVVREGRAYNRVLVGPYASLAVADDAIEELTGLGVEAFVRSEQTERPRPLIITPRAGDDGETVAAPEEQGDKPPTQQSKPSTTSGPSTDQTKAPEALAIREPGGVPTPEDKLAPEPSTEYARSAVDAQAPARRYVKSLLEMRRHRTVVQEWDLSCGAAALATVLSYQYDDPVPEREIAKALIRREEYIARPELVWLRQGFSLLDLKRYVDQRGYEGVGYGQLTIENLIEHAPIMVPVNFKGYNHFVVFRGMLGDRVLMSDPAWGDRTMRLGKFENAWLSYPEVGKVGFVVLGSDGATATNALAPRPSDFVLLR